MKNAYIKLIIKRNNIKRNANIQKKSKNLILNKRYEIESKLVFLFSV
jgi:hypothetical protein